MKIHSQPVRSSKPSIAIVVPDLATAGGLSAVANFLYNTIQSSEKYYPVLISVPMSSKDFSSVRALAPKTWIDDPKIVSGSWLNRPYQHVGAWIPEFEFQRYMPRRVLTELLNRHDIIQVVAGSPAWAMLSRKVSKPVFLQVATLARSERQSRIGTLSGPRNLLVRTMTAITGQIEELALKHVHKVFVENTRMHRWVSHRKGTQAVVYALPGVDTNSFKPNGYKGKSYILAVGRFADLRKNPDMLFRAYAEIKKMMITPPQLVLAGNSMPPEKSIALAKELDIISHLQLYEKIDTAQLSKLYREASLFVLSSDEEGLGIVVLEAMASGLPVVATRCGGPEMVVAHGETGYLVNIRDHVELAQRMKDILTNSMLARHMGERGRKLIEKRFSLKAAGLAFLDAYDALPNLR